ncbi:hypothetical protein RN001_005183 [Aquatica leii]|uniref:Tyr recombinase domain-containing protein n=1 Tax=Aquatica leii TaxID=1421715 RepID=A0AAN7SIP6_9COLE|nr:hypothetical protein RN001_005183 [Aquatica leii]
MCSAQNFVELSCTLPELLEIANNAIQKLLPTKSKPKYEKEYKKFFTWCDDNNVNDLTENISSTMWSSYSMLRTCLSIYKNNDISKYLKITAYLKRQSENYHPKKSTILQSEDIIKFISDTDDYTFLAMKVILIIEYFEACRQDEMTHVRLNNIEFKSDRIEVTVFATKNNISRVFLITEVSWIALIKKYVELRPPHTSHNRLFLTYRRGRCTVSPVGINKIGEVPKNTAKFLKLSNYETYTGHCFRRSSASHLANQGGDLLTIKNMGTGNHQQLRRDMWNLL